MPSNAKTSTLDLSKGHIEMAHGSGGRASSQLVDQLFIPAFDNIYLDEKSDQATLTLDSTRIVMATDSHVISPLFFPGGDIGSLSIHGTVNDVSMSGAKPLYLSAGFIVEEGFPLSELDRIVRSMAKAASAAGVKIVTGDTKVVERGQADGLYINTTGIGILPEGVKLSAANIQAGDKILVSGTVGDHGTCIMSQRQGFEFSSNLKSDSQALNDLVASMLSQVPRIRCLRDPTRGGVASVLHEFCHQRSLGMQLREVDIPVKPEVRASAELLGLDPLYIANEGKLIAICPAKDAEALLSVMRAHAKGQDAAIIGEVTNDENELIQFKTLFGGNRLIDWRYSEPLPRIC
jgi:hydrogenase expression/formation protein HypE